MFRKTFAGFALALSLLAPAFGNSKFDAGALAVERVSDQGPAVILIPGLASGAWAWKDTAERLRGTHSVYLLTLPGFDGRPRDANATFESLQQDLLGLIESKQIFRPVLVGHSLGGTLSLAFATAHSDKIAGVIAVDGLSVFPGTERMTGDRSALAANMRAQIAGLSPEQFVASQQAYMKQIGSIDEKTALALAERSSRSDPGATAEFAAQVMALDLRPKLGGIKVPVVEVSPFNAPDFAAMGVDENGKAAYYRMLLSGIEKLDVVSVAPARHFVMFDQPEKFAAALDRALLTMFESRAK
jgi:pimeloyl-ACP methyl ester carboxylesterase